MTNEERYEIDRILQLRRTLDSICDNAVIDKYTVTPRDKTKEIIESITYQLEEFERVANR